MDTLGFDGRVAIVTGAGAGLGHAYALLLAERGAAVVVNDLGSSVSGEGADRGLAGQVAKEIEELGGVAVADAHSVASADGGQAIVNTAMEAFGRVDIVINNAGILRDKSLHKMAPEDFDAVLDVHLKGTFLLSRAAFPLLRGQGYGRIVNTTSPAGLYGNFGQVNYGAAKMGIVGLSRSLAHEGAKHGVHVNVISPGAYTRMTEALITEGAEQMAPRHVAPAVVWLCHETCDLNGEVIAAAGGRVAHVFVGETRGYWSSGLTVEEVVANRDRIFDRDGALTPAGIYDTVPLIAELAR